MHTTIDFLLRHLYATLFLWVLAEQIGLPHPQHPGPAYRRNLSSAAHRP